MEILQGNTMENGGKQNPKMGFKSLPSRIPVLMPRKLTIGKISRISIFQRKTGR